MAAILVVWKSVCDMPIPYLINCYDWPSRWMEINLNAPNRFRGDKVPTHWNGSIPKPTNPRCQTSALLPSRRCGDPWCHATARWGTPVARRTCERWSAWRGVPEKLLQPEDSSPAQTQTKKEGKKMQLAYNDWKGGGGINSVMKYKATSERRLIQSESTVFFPPTRIESLPLAFP